MNLSVVLLSGPCGVGKSTITKALADKLDQTMLIEGDLLFHMISDHTINWEQKLAITWRNILSVTNNALQTNLNVVIDYVVEEELDWFISQLMKENIEVYYIVLIANEETIRNRIEKRGDIELLHRSSQLLQELSTKQANIPFLYDTTNKSITDVVQDLEKNMKHFRYKSNYQ